MVNDFYVDALAASYADKTCLLFTDKSCSWAHYKTTVGANKFY